MAVPAHAGGRAFARGLYRDETVAKLPHVKRSRMDMKQTVPILVAVPDELLRAGLLQILAGTRYKALEMKGGWEAARDSGKPLPPLVIVFMPGETADPDRSKKAVAAMAERSKVIVLADQCEAEACRDAFCSGASAYLPRSIGADTLLQVLDLVQAGEVVFPGSLTAGVVGCGESPPVPTTDDTVTQPTVQSVGESRLSSREVEILQRLVHGESNKQISRQLDISETTVKVHIKAVLRKLRVCNRTQAAIWGLEHLLHGTGASAVIRPLDARPSVGLSPVPSVAAPNVAPSAGVPRGLAPQAVALRSI